MFRIQAKQGVVRGLATVGVVVAAIAASMPSASAATSGRSLAKPDSVRPAGLSCVWKGPIKNAEGDYFSELRHQGGAALYMFSAGTTTWCLQSAAEGGYYLLPVADNGTLCLDGGTQRDGDPVQLWACNGTMTQRWNWDGAGQITRRNIPELGLVEDGAGSQVFMTLSPVGTPSDFYKA